MARSDLGESGPHAGPRGAHTHGPLFLGVRGVHTASGASSGCSATTSTARRRRSSLLFLLPCIEELRPLFYTLSSPRSRQKERHGCGEAGVSGKEQDFMGVRPPGADDEDQP
ncbi:hypothetical protein EYF80_004529 [Liparis tanakae]|uniref:Uncharacterized protein n=1 Tax=Liparis tanakae TaxID=230148 RepID=A0A4Z2J4P7_9TELE|nr:hypothetical protein EYF80_004529 [Liparis tanakae]